MKKKRKHTFSTLLTSNHPQPTCSGYSFRENNFNLYLEKYFQYCKVSKKHCYQSVIYCLSVRPLTTVSLPSKKALLFEFHHTAPYQPLPPISTCLQKNLLKPLILQTNCIRLDDLTNYSSWFNGFDNFCKSADVIYFMGIFQFFFI